MTEMVGEFPELQGLMGRYYAAAQGEDVPSPRRSRSTTGRRGAGDSVPTEPVAIAVALADKLDTLVGVLGDRREADRLEGPLSRCAARRSA